MQSISLGKNQLITTRSKSVKFEAQKCVLSMAPLALLDVYIRSSVMNMATILPTPKASAAADTTLTYSWKMKIVCLVFLLNRAAV
jgi:hypothetical protein